MHAPLTPNEQELTASVRQLTAERKRVEQALQSESHRRECAEAALRESERRKDEFLATLAHELRNPLAPIRSAVQIMRMAEGDHATAAAARAMIERQLKHLVRLIDDLMDASRITQGKLELRRERVDLAAVIQIAVETNRPLLEGKQQHLKIEMPAGALYVDADTTRLAQAFSNVLNNSAKYTDAHGDIAIRVVREDAHAIVTISDSGIGIRPDMLDHVFDLFTRVQGPQAAPHDGLGVGLSLAKRLIELHGGSVSAYSEGPDKGSSFIVRLDLIDAVDAQAGLTRPVARAGTDQPRARILIADDNHDAAQSLAMVLGMEGHDVRTANDGVEALQIAEEFRPQVILLDIGMPKLDGYETARRLRTRPWARRTLLFAQTGWGQEDDKQRATQAGFDRHLVKPLDPEVLNQLLMECLTENGGRTHAS
jgi:signal transduction histidine kinase/CheY-like chemotaxis protein